MMHSINRRQFVQLGLLSGAALAGDLVPIPAVGAEQEEVLYNGIRLPSPWPPQLKELPNELPTPEYLKSPPSVIPIDLGRQLFVDDFLIERTDLKRTYHQATYHSQNPVLTGGMVFSDGVWYDPDAKLFKMWYMTKEGTAYATSSDGIRWEKPQLDVKKGTNLVELNPRDSSTIWLDLAERNPQRRYKMFRSDRFAEKKAWRLWVHFSADGIHWSEGRPTGAAGDRTTVFYNPFRKVWVYSLRSNTGPRSRRYWETRDDVVAGAQWGEASVPAYWVGSDKLDPPRSDYKVTPQLYNLDCTAYESLLLGLFTIWRGQFPGREKPNEVCLGFSRDGWSWTRPERRAFCPISETLGEWNYGNVQSAGGGCLVVGDRLHFYVSGRGNGWVTSLATLRRDGFASMDAASSRGTLTTRSIRFGGSHLFVNADAAQGELKVEVLDEGQNVIEPFTTANCLPMKADKVKAHIAWKGAENLHAVAGGPVRLRFSLRNGRLFSFWVSRDTSGASDGFLAAGGPGFAGHRDT